MNPRTRVLVVFAVLVAVAGYVAFMMLRAPARQASGGGGGELTQTPDPITPVKRATASVRMAAPRAAPVHAAPGAETPAGGVLARVGWGSGAQEVGRNRPQEGNPEAPMSLALDDAGRVLVLDQVNGRVLRFGRDGTTESIPVASQSPQDVVVTKNGTLAVLDRLSDKAISLVDPSGKVLGEIPLEGKGVPEGGGVSGVFADGDDLWVESEHGTVVRVGDATGGVDEQRTEAPGRPTKDGRSWVNAGIIEMATGRVRVTLLDRATGAHRVTRELRLGAPVHAILLLDSDGEGFIYLAVMSMADETNPASAKVLLFVLDGVDAHPLARRELPASTGPDETFRDFAVRPDGTVVYAHRDEEGMTLREYRLR